MSTDTQKYSEEYEREARHSALEEFSRDERRPAVLLLGALVIAAIFFALGIMVGRWTTKPSTSSPALPTNQQRQIVPVNLATPAQPSPSPSSTVRQVAQPSTSR